MGQKCGEPNLEVGLPTRVQIGSVHPFEFPHPAVLDPTIPELNLCHPMCGGLLPHLQHHSSQRK